MLRNNTQTLLKKEVPLKVILIIEDDTKAMKFLTLMISSEVPSTYLIFADGYEALRVIKIIIPDLILVDSHLPEVNGFAFYDLLRSTKGQAETSVIFLNTSTSPDNEKEVLLLERPFGLNALIEVIKNVYTEA